MTFFIRRNWKTALLGALTIGLCSANAQAKDTAAQIAARRAIAAQYVRLEKAILIKDSNALMALIAPDFNGHLRNGMQLNRAQYEGLQKYAAATPTERITSIRFKVEKIQWRGVDAIVWVDGTKVFPYQGHRVEVNTQSRDYWRPSPRGWVISQSAELKTRTWVDGRLVPTQ